MTTAPAEDQRRLLDVQALDTRTSQLAHQRRTHPSLARLTELDGRLADVETSLVASRTAVRDLRRELAKAEADVEQVRSRADRDRARMDSGRGSAKDMQALASELTALGRRQGELEEVELEIMERLEAHEAALAELDAAADVIRGQHAEAVTERDAAFATIDAEAEQVAGQRAELAQGLDAGLVALYDRLRGQLGGLGAAALRGRRCEGCRLELNPMDVEAIRRAAPEQVARCEECGRILVRLPEPAKA
ncbi:zinc ribbon domain-containing protein [uncultured Cellulomonas sp.]|uniref:zinc ribbon domain-containing protein n=1 Tax=uncultured Cellulomonas sp. TaxID=189682 RepID=UPI00261BF416|nr:C4-type zinc ribbon domain-containing protein [uncultured Cellulomonas sp.]